MVQMELQITAPLHKLAGWAQNLYASPTRNSLDSLEKKGESWELILSNFQT